MANKVHFSQLLREVHFFDLTKLGRLSRAAFWSALLAHLFFLSVLFIVPFETAYQLQLAPDSWFVLFWMNVFSFAVLASLVPLKRLAVRRLHDAGFSGMWLWMVLIPYAGWLTVVILLLLPASVFPNRFDRFAEPDVRSKGQKKAAAQKVQRQNSVVEERV